MRLIDRLFSGYDRKLEAVRDSAEADALRDQILVMIAERVTSQKVVMPCSTLSALRQMAEALRSQRG